MYPKNIQAALDKHPTATVTERGVELVHKNGTTELLISARGFADVQPAKVEIEVKAAEPKAEVVEEPKPRAKPGPKPKEETKADEAEK